MIPVPATHDDARAQEWFARLDPIIRKHGLRGRPHGVAVLVNALNAAGVPASLLTCKISAGSAAKKEDLPLVLDSKTQVMLVDGCVIHSHGTVGTGAWKSAHLQAHRAFRDSIQPVITPMAPLSAHGMLPPAARHRPGQAGFAAIKPCYSRWKGHPRIIATTEIYRPGPNDPWPGRLRDDLASALSTPAPPIRRSSGFRTRPPPKGLGMTCEPASLQLDGLARHWMAYGKASAADLLWAAATLLNNDEVASRLWCRPVTRFTEDGALSSDLAIAVSFRRGGRRYLAHLGDPARWGLPEPTLTGSQRAPDYLAVHFDYMNAKPALDWMAAYTSAAMQKTTPHAHAAIKPRAPRF